MARQTLETRVESQEQRVTVLEQLPERMDRLESQFLLLRAEMRDEFSAVRAEMAAGDEETRRFSRVLQEDVVGRISIIGEGLAASVEAIKALAERVDTIHTSLSRAIDASRSETRAMFEQVVSRFDASTATLNKPRRSKKQ